MAGEMKAPGLNREDEYFHRKDQELLTKLREKAEAQRTELADDHQKKAYWMRCPKCGSSLKEESYGGIVVVDRCSSAKCGGIFFDGGELEILLKAKSSLLKRILGG